MIKVNGTIIETDKTFPDGSLAMKVPYQPGAGLVHVQWNYENDAELFALICLRKKFGSNKVILHMPYIPHARMDRVKNDEDVFTLKYFCDIINSLDFDKVCVLDAHSNVSLALLDRVIQIPVEPHINAAITQHDRGNTALFFPDEGSMKRYADYFNSIPFSFGMKKRDWSTGKILGLEIMQTENIIGKDVLIIDDICCAGGTFYYAARALMGAGAKSVSVYVTHCENTLLHGKLIDCGLIENIYTTDSLVHCEELKTKVIYV